MPSARLARLALALYPLAYRRRYGEEMEALLEDSGRSPTVVADLLRGAIGAHLRPEPAVAATVGSEDRVRLGLSSILFCWVLFALAGLGLYKTTETRALEGTAAPGMLGGIHLAIQILAAGALAAVALGAAPLILAALRQSAARPDTRRQARSGSGAAAGHAGLPLAVRGAVGLGAVCVATFAAASVALIVVANSGAGLADGLGALILGAWALVALACGVGCALAARRGLFATPAAPRALAFAHACATVVAGTMVGIAALLAAYLVDLEAAAPGLAGQANGPLGVPGVALSLSLLLIAMVALAVPAALSATRTWRRPVSG